MGAAVPPLLLVTEAASAAAPLRGWLEPHGFAVQEAAPRAIPEQLASFAALILDGHSDTGQALALCRRLALRPLDDRPPLVYLAPDDSAAARLAGFAHGADVVLPGSATGDEVLAEVRVLERWHRAKGQWQARAADALECNHQLRQAYETIEKDLKMARRLQASFLPRTLPAVGPVRFAVSYRPCGQVGGDFYDVFRLDERHVGFYVADAMGHGVPASLLTVFLKKAVQPKEVSGTSYRLVPPDEVLARLNRDLIAQGLADLPFITMVYGLLDCQSGGVDIARAGHPYPVYLPRVGEPESWESPGTLLGVFEAEYPVLRRQLHPGDKLLVFTDGLPTEVAEIGQPGPVLHAAAEHRGLPIEAFVDRVTEALLAEQERPDDFTLLGVELLAE